jgi:NADH dehydrogenase
LEVQALPSVWALGDCALVPNGKNGGFDPPTAQHALREGRCVAGNVAAEILGRRKKPFRFATLDSLAAIGKRTGVANVFGLKFSGLVALAHCLSIQASSLRKEGVALDWTLDLCFAKDFACVTAGSPLPARRLALQQGADRAA